MISTGKAWSGTDVGSAFVFSGQNASISNTEYVTIVGQNFGFDLENGITEVELDMSVPETETDACRDDRCKQLYRAGAKSRHELCCHQWYDIFDRGTADSYVCGDCSIQLSCG